MSQKAIIYIKETKRRFHLKYKKELNIPTFWDDPTCDKIETILRYGHLSKIFETEDENIILALGKCVEVNIKMNT